MSALCAAKHARYEADFTSERSVHDLIGTMSSFVLISDAGQPGRSLHCSHKLLVKLFRFTLFRQPAEIMRRVAEISSFLKQRIVIEFCVLIGKPAAETMLLLDRAYGAATLKKSQIFYWHKSFLNGRQDVLDKPRAPRRKTGRSAENVEKVKELIEGDRRLSVTGLSGLTGIPATSVFRILTKDLCLKRRSAKFVPHLLTPAQQTHRLEVSQRMLQRIAAEPDLLSCVITMDETWTYQYDPELKAQSSEWLSSTDPRPVKCIRERAVGKVMLISFFDMGGMLHYEFFHQIVTGEMFVQVLQRLRESILHRRGKQYLKDCSLHMDNASPHTCLDTRKFLIQCGMKVVEHPPYSPDLAPSDFWLYPCLKKPLRGRRYENLKALKEAVRLEIGNISSEEFKDCINKQWPCRWAHCVNSNGAYFEGVSSNDPVEKMD